MLILALQFFDGDKSQAMGLARLIADLEPVPRNDVYFLFSARFDCKHDEETVKYVSQKFRVLRHTTKRKFTGWPNGPNQQMGCTYEHCVELWKRNQVIGVEAVMLMEADCVPLARNWLDLLIAEYRGCGKAVLGAWLKFGDANCEHINGNCIIRINFWKKFPSIMHPPSRGGWDAALKHGILPNGAPSKLIWSDYQLGQPNNPWKNCEYLWEPKFYRSPDNPLYGQELHPVWFHGIKTTQGIECVRDRFLNENVQ